MDDRTPDIRIAVIVNGKIETSRPAMFEETMAFSNHKANKKCTIENKTHERSER